MQADVERFLARLLSDRGLRERFAADPAGVARQEGLSEAEADSVARMPAPDLRIAARSYEHKRHSKRGAGGPKALADWFWAKFR
jgi:hypothetical protein